MATAILHGLARRTAPQPQPPRSSHSANMQDNEEVTVTVASKALKVGERGIYHAKDVLAGGTPEEIAAPQWEPRKPLGGTRKPRCEAQTPAGPKLRSKWRVFGPSWAIRELQPLRSVTQADSAQERPQREAGASWSRSKTTDTCVGAGPKLMGYLSER